MGEGVDESRLAGCKEDYEANCPKATKRPKSECKCQTGKDDGADVCLGQPEAPMPSTCGPEEVYGELTSPGGGATTAVLSGAGAASSRNSPSFPGAVDTRCLQPYCWIGYGCKKCMPKHARCLKVGHSCGTYVWVLPRGQDELTKLTLLVLNYAYNDPTPMRTKNVTWELADNGFGCAGGKCACPDPGEQAGNAPTDGAAAKKEKKSTANGRKITISATLPFDEPVVPYCGDNTCRSGANYNVFERPFLQYGQSQPSPIPGEGYLQFQQNQQNLTPSAR